MVVLVVVRGFVVAQAVIDGLKRVVVACLICVIIVILVVVIGLKRELKCLINPLSNHDVSFWYNMVVEIENQGITIFIYFFEIDIDIFIFYFGYISIN